jgi:hypothetical protein
MFRSSLIAAGAALLCTAASAQQQLPTSRMYPITTPIKNAGTVDVVTGKWHRPGQATVKAGVDQTIYNNTCTWQTQGYYGGFDWCEENYDTGRIPGTSAGSNGLGQQTVQDVNTITSIQVSYCTFVGPLLPGAGYDMDLAFWDKLNGNCVGGIPPTPPPISSSANSYIPLGGIGLPGSTTTNFQACWLITLNMTGSGMVIGSDGGDGVYDTTDVDDSFVWMQRQNTTVGALNGLSAGPDGFFITGEPATGGFGACSYNIPCGIDALFGNTCGTGLDAFDASWINVDGIAVGASGQPAGCVNTVAQYGYGTNCYFFGGYPTNPLASYYLVLKSDERMVTGGGVSYCDQSSRVASSVAGCYPTLSVANTGAGVWDWKVTSVPRSGTLCNAGTTVGLWIYNNTTVGQSTFTNATPFGTLCLQGFKRSSGPPSNPICGAAGLILDNNAGWVSGTGNCGTNVNTMTTSCGAGVLGLSAGQDVNVMAWMRDPTDPDGCGPMGSTGNAIFSNAVYYVQ